MLNLLQIRVLLCIGTALAQSIDPTCVAVHESSDATVDTGRQQPSLALIQKVKELTRLSHSDSSRSASTSAARERRTSSKTHQDPDVEVAHPASSGAGSLNQQAAETAQSSFTESVVDQRQRHPQKILSLVFVLVALSISFCIVVKVLGFLSVKEPEGAVVEEHHHHYYATQSDVPTTREYMHPTESFVAPPPFAEDRRHYDELPMREPFTARQSLPPATARAPFHGRATVPPMSRDGLQSDELYDRSVAQIPARGRHVNADLHRPVMPQYFSPPTSHRTGTHGGVRRLSASPSSDFSRRISASPSPQLVPTFNRRALSDDAPRVHRAVSPAMMGPHPAVGSRFAHHHPHPFHNNVVGVTWPGRARLGARA